MQIGLIGFPGAGVKTIFSAITGLTQSGGVGSTTIGTSRLAVLKVPDPRLELISSVYKPRKSTPATVDIAEFPGVFGPHADARLLAKCRESDALALVLGAFENAGSDSHGGAAPGVDAGPLKDEMILADLAIAEARLERLTSSLSKKKDDTEKAEHQVLVKCREQLDQGRPLLDLELTAEDAKRIRGFGFLSRKPAFVLINIGEAQLGSAQRLVEQLSKQGVTARALCGDIESELARIEGADREELMKEFGISELAAPEVLRAAYECLQVCTFYTYGEDECRAWTLQEGQTAVDAAGRIHTDLARGFIRAEVVSFADFREHGDIKKARAAGRFRLEGKEYVVADGDLIIIRHSS